MSRELLDAVDLFAGPGGWDLAARWLGLRRIVGLEWDKAACATRAAAGHLTIRCDVATYPTAPFIGRTRGLIGSPPCQAWSNAGKGRGKADRPFCHDLIDRMAAGDDSTDWREWADPRSPLVAQPVRWVRDLRPEWVALEQVPPVLSLWEHVARVLRAWGYSVWCGVLSGEQYGVPQTRRRAILIASLTVAVHPPMPTHQAWRGSKRPPVPDMFTEPFITMAGALGWGATARPMPTVTAGGSAAGGAEPLARGGRAALAVEAGGGRWRTRPATDQGRGHD